MDVTAGLNGTGWALFVAALGLLLMGHVFRAIRMTTFYTSTSGAGRFELLLGLALGYCVNTIIPARLGELVRVLYVGKRCHIRYAYVAATVACERLSDAVVVGLVCLTLVAAKVIPPSLSIVVAEVTILTLIACLFAYFTRVSRAWRRITWKVVSVFNLRISYGLLDLFWSYSELMSRRQMLRPKYLLLTAVMWGFYGGSYALFGIAVQRSLTLVVSQMLGSPLHSMVDRAIHGRLGSAEYLILAFGVIPVLAVLAIGLIHETGFVRVCSSLFRGQFKTWDSGSTLVSEHFKEHSEYDFFLTSLFAEDDRRVTGFGLNAIEDAVVHRLFQGGSGAITALVEADDQLLIRKFAIGELKYKLKQQVDWIREFQGKLPLVSVLADRTDRAFYRYDMPFSPTAQDFYDVIHTAPIAKSLGLLGNVILTLNDFHANHESGLATDEMIAHYCQDKVSKNASSILKFVADLIPGNHYRLNDADYSLDDWTYLRDINWLHSQLKDRRITQIHGDLTIENIIVDPTQPSGWYLIDPNPGNLFDSPFIDWAKLRQSLHLGYEGLNKGANCHWTGSELSIALTRSHAYDQLHAMVEDSLTVRLGKEAHREIRFHELVNYLRLTPYKIRQDSAKGLAFFACTSILLRQYLEDYL